MKYSFALRDAVIVFAFLLTACDRSATVPPPVDKPVMTNAVVEPARPKPQFEKLLGRWERPDGGYVLEFRSVDADGKLDAGYFNPGPIKVERALAVLEAGSPKVFVVLRDVNYPGCTYKLTYDVKADQLFGQYFQASMNETYDVAFGRQKADGQ